MTCYVLSAAPLHLTIALFDHKRLPHDQLGSIESTALDIFTEIVEQGAI